MCGGGWSLRRRRRSREWMISTMSVMIWWRMEELVV
jgi:hypothetical protein